MTRSVSPSFSYFSLASSASESASLDVCCRIATLAKEPVATATPSWQRGPLNLAHAPIGSERPIKNSRLLRESCEDLQ